MRSAAGPEPRTAPQPQPAQSWGAPPRRAVQPYTIIEPMRWHGAPVPPRRWMVRGLVPRGAVTMITGDGGVGKSLLAQQLLTAAAVGRDFLDCETTPCRALGIFCEDDADELHRRTASICEHYGVAPGDLEHLNLVSRVGLDNVLMDFDRRSDHGTATAFFDQVLTHAKAFGAQLIVIDTSADTFAGNENIRAQVRQFVNQLRRMAIEADGAVVLTSHPSVAGMQTGTGLSGSTAWNNTVRQRVYLTRGEEEGADSDARVLRTMKSNYGRSGAMIRLRWHAGVFQRVDPAPPPGNVVDRIALDTRVLDAVRALVTSGTRISADRNNPRSGFPNVLRKHETCRDYSFNALVAIQERLVEEGRLVATEMGPKSKRVLYVRPADMRYPGEE